MVRYFILYKIVENKPVSKFLISLGIVSASVLMLYYVILTVVATLLLRKVSQRVTFVRLLIWLISIMILTGVLFDCFMLKHGNIEEAKHASMYYVVYQMARSTLLYVLVMLLVKKLSSMN